MKLQVSRRKEVTKIRAEKKKIETKKILGEISETKSWFFEKINKTDKLLARLTKKKREKTNKITNERGDIADITTKDSNRLLWTIYINKLDNIEEMDTFLETCKTTYQEGILMK